MTDISALLSGTLAVAPELALIVVAVAILAGSAASGKSGGALFFALAAGGVAAAFVLNLGRFSAEVSAFSGALRIDSFSAFLNSIFLLAAAATLFLSKDHLGNRAARLEEFCALLLLGTAGMMILASSVELVTLFLGFEIMSIAVYVLSGWNPDSERSTESGVKYLVLGGFSSAVMLFGIALLYGASGSTFLTEIFRGPSHSPMYVCGTVLVAAGAVFKAGAVPLHQWVPDIYDGAPLTVAGYMSVAVKTAAFALLMRIFLDSSMSAGGYLPAALQVVAVLTMVVGNIAAVYQKSVKRMLAYSSVAHAGYALVGVAAVLRDPSVGSGSVFYYLFAYAFMNLGAFGVLAYASGEKNDCDTFEKISGLWKRRPAGALALAVFMFSLAGIPPTAGFFAKYRVFAAAVDAGLAPLAVVGVVASVISVYYYLRVLAFAFMKEDSYGAGKSGPLAAATIAALAAGAVFFGIFPLFSWDMALRASAAISAAAPF